MNKKLLLLILSIIILTAAGIGYYYQPIGNEAGYLTILHTNDIHGRLAPFEYKGSQELVGGIAGRAALIKQVESANKCAITIDAGDFSQGSLFFNIFKGVPDAELMSLAGYDVGTLGNHEFDKGLTVLKNMVKEFTYPIVASNISFPDEPELAAMVKPYTVKNYCGKKIAFIGLVPEDLKSLSGSKNIEVFSAELITRTLAEKLNPHADLIVVISHLGVKQDIKLAKAVPEIDVIIGGHSHTLMEQPVLFHKNKDQTLVVQGGELGVYLGRLDLKFKDKKIENYYYDLIPINEKVTPDLKIKNRVAALSEQVKGYTQEIIGQLEIPLGIHGEHIRSRLLPSGALITEAIKSKFPEADVVLQNSGGIRPYKHLGPGAITRADIVRLFPFENTVVLVELKGEELESVLETSSKNLPGHSGGFLQSLGLEYAVETDEEAGDRVSKVLVNNKPLKDDQYYTVAINDYMFDGGNGYTQFKNAAKVKDTGVKVQDIIVDYIRENSPVTVEVRDKIHFDVD